MQIEPLRPHPAEADGITYPTDPDPVPEDQPALGSQRDLDGQLALGLTLQAGRDEIPAQVLRIRENARIAQAKLDDLASLPLPAPEEDDRSPGLAWPAQPGHDRDAVLQPPQPVSSPPPGSWSVTRLHNENPGAAKLNRDDDTACPAYRGFRGHRTRAWAVSARHNQAPRPGRGRP